MLSIIQLSIILLSVFKLSIIMMSFIMLIGISSVIMLSGFVLTIIQLNAAKWDANWHFEFHYAERHGTVSLEGGIACRY
jgi:hypothetical protein